MEALPWGEEGELEAGTCSGQMEISRQGSPQTLCSGRKGLIWPVILLRVWGGKASGKGGEAERVCREDRKTQVLPSRLSEGTVTAGAG